MLILQTKVDFSIVFVYVMFSIGIVQMNVVKHNFDITKNRRILPSSTSVIKQITLSPIECAFLCSLEETCCYASYDRITNHCYLDGSCCPQNESSVDALMLKKNTGNFFFLLDLETIIIRVVIPVKENVSINILTIPVFVF